ncbi:uncharacterized protein LOC117176510 [Belonocnema kinseyi]|uniref:uncharacterized protein LOC117176510 n=1 Tax=Belonocnema kinseyi TaxID=2817044 RepID=UPI00143CE678|nr:uncharacterized protein LOC117176510 [Belonocnema kinseyi]
MYSQADATAPHTRLSVGQHDSELKKQTNEDRIRLRQEQKDALDTMDDSNILYGPGIDYESIILVLTTTIVFIVTFLLWYLATRKPEGYPPGPKWWPILGSMLEVDEIRRKTGSLPETFTALSQKYGPVVGLKIGVDRIVILNSFESMRSMCMNDLCDARPTGPVYEVRTFGKKQGLILADGNLWVEQRRFVLRHLREFGFGRTSMATFIEEEARHLVEHFNKLLQKSSKSQSSISRDTNYCFKERRHPKNGQIYQFADETEKKLKNKNSLKPISLADAYTKSEDSEEIRRLSQSSGVVIKMNDAFGVPVLNTIWRMMTGQRFNTNDKQILHLQRILNKLLEEIDMIGCLFGHFPLLRFIAPEASGYKAFLETHQELWEFLKVEWQSHKETFDALSPRGLLDVYLQVLQSESPNETFSESQLLAICIDLFMAGSETTSKTLGFCFLYLLLYPDVQKKAQNEIDLVTCRQRLPSLNDKARLTYVTAIVYEALRIFMGKTLNVPHRASEDTYILDHRIPKTDNQFRDLIKALYGVGLAVTPSMKSVVGFSSPGTTENVNSCKRVATMTKILLLNRGIIMWEISLVLTTALVFIVTLLLWYLATRKPEGYPPGPKWWPILGSALEVEKIRRKTGSLPATFTALSQKYGPVIGLKIGVDRIVILNSFESMRSMCTNDLCDARPTGPVYEVRTFGKRQGLIVTDGNLWVEQRRFVLRHLREFGFGRTSMATLIEEEAHHLVEHFKKLFRESSRSQSSFSRDNDFPFKDKQKSKNGQIYQLVNEIEKKIENKKDLKPMSLNDVYAKAEDYEEIRRLFQSTGVVVRMNDAFGVPVLNTLWRMMAGRRFNTDDKQMLHLQRILNKLLGEIDMIGCPFGHFPILRFIAPEASGYKAFLETHQELWEFLKIEWKSHKETFDPLLPRDLMDVYLQVLQSESPNDTFSESQLLAICVDLFMAGSETTSKTLGFCFLYMLLYPDIQKKAQNEIDSITCRERLPSLNDKTRMTYVNAIVYESLRMFMGRTLNVPHRASEDTFILGHRIPKDTMLVVNFNRVLMDDNWKDPEAFRPERFIDDEGKLFLPDTFLPFSLGKHRCMGEVLAKSNIFVIVATLLHEFTFSVVPGEETPTTDFIDGVTAGPTPYRALLKQRN